MFLSFISASNVGLVENSTWQGNLTPVRFSATAFGDIDNDNDLDLAVIGCLPGAGGSKCTIGTIAKIYINNGSTLIENSTWQSNLTAVGWGALAFGDVDNDGDLDLGLSGCTNVSDQGLGCNGNIVSKIYVNNGTSLVEDSIWQQNITTVYDPSMALGDIDNDGDLDLVMNGKSPSLITKVYINNGTNFLENSIWQNELTAINEGQVAFGDVDNDGDLDLALTGDSGGPSDFTSFYINNGTSFVESTQWNNNLTNMDRSSLTFINYDNDEYLDLMICGHTNADKCHLYRNNGSALLLNQSQDGSGCLPGIYRASIAFGDYDNDGDLDLVDIGNEAGRAGVCENNATNNYDFLDDALAHSNISDDLKNGALAWSDVDNDGDLDLLIATADSGLGTSIAKIFINNNTISNTLPNASTSDFSSSYSNNVLTLGWGNGSDTETNTSGLYYNLMVGNSTTNHTVVSGVYGGSSGGGGGAGGGANGYFGNMMQRKNITLNVQLESNKTYYWYVQTIDTGLATSNWSTRQSFTTSLDTTKPNITLESPSPSAGFHTTNPVFVFNATVTDANLTNVTLYADFNGTLIANETNSSGLNGTYIFNKTLANDNQYQWYIEACDSELNCQSSGTRNFFLDRIAPVVTSISPSNGATSSSASVIFSYNVSDVDVANCSLVIDGSIDQTDTSITEDATQTFTKSLANADYTWYVNCTDYVGFTNSSISRSLTVSVSSGGGGGGSGGGGTITFWTRTDSVGDEELEKGVVKELSKKQRLKVSVSGETHYIGVVELTATTATINITSNPIQVVLSIGEEARVDILDDGFYDIYVLLNNITNDKANLTIQSIHEEIPEGEEAVVVSGEGEEVEETDGEGDKKNRLLLWIVILIVAAIIIIFLSRYFLERHRNRFNNKVKIVKKKMGNKLILIKRKHWKKRLKNKMKRGVIRWLR